MLCRGRVPVTQRQDGNPAESHTAAAQEAVVTTDSGGEVLFTS